MKWILKTREGKWQPTRKDKCLFPNLAFKSQEVIVQFVINTHFSEACLAATVMIFPLQHCLKKTNHTVLRKPGCVILDDTHHLFDTKLTYKGKQEKLKIMLY